MACSPLASTSVRSVFRLSGCTQGQMTNHICGIGSRAHSNSCFYFSTGYSRLKYTDTSVSKTKSYSSAVPFQASQKSCFGSCISKQRWHSITVKKVFNYSQFRKIRMDFSSGCHNMNVRLLLPKQGAIPEVKCNSGPLSWSLGCVSAGLTCGLLVCYSTSQPAHAEAAQPDENKEDSSAKFSHGKRVYTDYSVIGIPGDGRCLFRSVAHGACLRSGKPAPSGSLQKELADDLRAKVADEFVKRRKETEWFVEGDFDTYVLNIRKPHVWGGEPELFMASHVLQMPITVYMHDQDSGGLIIIAEYGQEYGKENPIKVLYHGFGHYDALQIPGKKGAQSRL